MSRNIVAAVNTVARNSQLFVVVATFSGSFNDDERLHFQQQQLSSVSLQKMKTDPAGQKRAKRMMDAALVAPRQCAAPFFFRLASCAVVRLIFHPQALNHGPDGAMCARVQPSRLSAVPDDLRFTAAAAEVVRNQRRQHIFTL